MLSGTSLDPMPVNGILNVTPGSDNATATIAIDQPLEKQGTTHLIPLTDTNGTPDRTKSPTWSIPVVKGSLPVVTLGGTVSKNFIIFELVF